ncbi:hypothetical protein O181_081083 [Austropuccinia psidii MF-1]|uniref:Uncharacterized protein n=1 Tax=Austropuccinia psidii MF-1 TaxID=1389203 RepID=A0A9Q3FJW8_9BASI|nr:hypothetical protein [Austropuccinia psidii MF-1]
MDNKRFNLASHWAEPEASFQKICLKEIPFKDLLVIIKGWNPARKIRLLEERETWLRLTRSRKTQLSSSFTPFGHKKICGQESPFFTIPCSFQGKTRIQGQKQDFFEPKAERVRPNDPEVVGIGERSKQELDIIVNNSRISSSNNRNITLTQTEHNVFTTERNLNSDSLCF